MMAYEIEGNDVHGYRVIVDGSARSGRKKTVADALAVAGIEAEPAKKAAPAKPKK